MISRSGCYGKKPAEDVQGVLGSSSLIPEQLGEVCVGQLPGHFHSLGGRALLTAVLCLTCWVVVTLQGTRDHHHLGSSLPTAVERADLGHLQNGRRR